MISFLIALAVLLIGFLTYGKLVENIFEPDDRQTPAIAINDGVDCMPIKTWKALLIQLLNIAGTGPIFGALMGACFGPVVFLWIVLGAILAGAVHDYMVGMISERHEGASIAELCKIYIDKKIMYYIMRVFAILLLLLTGTVFVTSPAALISSLTPEFFGNHFWIIVILLYYIIATLLPIDKVIGKLYPTFGVILIIMAVSIAGGMLFIPQYHIPEINFSNLHPKNLPIWPFMFVTVACGAISGFHSSQSPIVARCMENEKDMRLVFYGAMVVEGILALIWAAIAMAFFHGQPQLAVIYGATPSVGVNEMATTLVGPIGLVLTIIGVVICPITTGDTALRAARITVADGFKLDQKTLMSRVKIALPLFIISFALTFVDFSLIWRYMAWAQLFIAVAVLLAATVYLIENKKHFIITFAPAIVCLVIAIAYILQAPEGLRLDSFIANLISVIITAIFSVYFIFKYRKSSKDLNEA